ncbi:uncharacterized protein C8R40DRAFT_1104396 [Lentinula edodes]|uniref:uncharacterized protein n=1 Tax=Lentinula edodes TaxID=5353 RepID=UPI001E8DFCCA|nr:uncharacterized protein C8R40DRAFT_1104396 [Lentinula edodes]KAH7875510.1 hypothetical protein C8R40DRAFT_1104396 [Lentinula edodes]
MKFSTIFFTSALIAAGTSALPTSRFVEREPARQFGGSRPPPGSPHLAHYDNGPGNSGDSPTEPESYSQPSTTTLSAIRTSTSTTTNTYQTQESSVLPLPVPILTQEYSSIVVPSSTGSDEAPSS